MQTSRLPFKGTRERYERAHAGMLDLRSSLNDDEQTQRTALYDAGVSHYHVKFRLNNMTNLTDTGRGE